MKLAIVLASLVAAATVQAGPRFSGSFDFAGGSAGIGTVDGAAVPLVHLEAGGMLGNLRLQGELDTGLWTDEGVADPERASGSFTRVGAGLRWYFMDLGKPDCLLRPYVESGFGHQWIAAPTISIDRDDVSFGFGFAQEAHVGKLWLGGHTGIRVLIADGVAASTACRGTCGSPAHELPDVALLWVLGAELGK